MKGFIEVTSPNGKEIAISASKVEGFEDGKIYVSDDAFNVKETYSELKALIEDATAEPKTERNYSLSSFGFSKDTLKGLSIRKEEQA